MIDIPGILDRAATRRGFLQWGAYGALAAALNQARLVGAVEQRETSIESCILLMLYGGPSQLDTWDMKPDAPAEIRGDYRPIGTSVPGQVVCEHLAQCARVADRMAVIRSMSHELTNHNAAMYQALIGRPPLSNDPILGADAARDFPNYGAAVSYLTAAGKLPPAAIPLTSVALPHVLWNVVDLPGQNAGFLGARHNPLQIESDPSLPAFHVRSLSRPPGVSENVRQTRRTLLKSLDKAIGSQADGSEVAEYRDRAFDLLHSPHVQSAFQIKREPDTVRDRYGRHKLGQSLLLARRLVEAGVRFINVHDGMRNGQDVNWDSHLNIFPRHRELLAPMDQGVSALIEDLDQRGLLESTLLIVMGEFGRTPRINANAGRDHWPNCYSVVLAGAGVIGGAVYGASDRSGAYPTSNLVTPGDLAATIFWRFGVAPQHEYPDPLGRSFPIATGKPLTALFGGA